jgi:tetratricopeptide (TPR) repeat protein
MEFNPHNHVIKLCVEGINVYKAGNAENAENLFFQAWNESKYDFEKFYAAYFIANCQIKNSDKLHWYETALQLALTAQNMSVNSALRALYTHIAQCYEDLGHPEKATQYHESANSLTNDIRDIGPFYHGTRANLNIGDLLYSGFTSNYDAKTTMNHIYFTAIISGATLAASLAKAEGKEHIYIVEPTGTYENDPNVTDKKFPGNPTRSYRSHAPLRIVGELTDWLRLPSVEVKKWQEKLSNNNGIIIN